MPSPNSDDQRSAPPLTTGNHHPAPPTTVPLNTPATSTPVPMNVSKTAQKKKRFRFLETYDLYLLKAVRSVDAHIPEWGKAEALYEEVETLFLREMPTAVFTISQKPSGRTLSDRFKRLVAHRRVVVKQNSAASGIVEQYGEKEVLLDDLITELDEKEEAARAEKQIQTENEKHLVVAGENIRGMALKMQRSEEGEAEGEGESVRSSAKKTRSRKRDSGTSDDVITTAMLSQAAARREIESNRLALDRERMQMERVRAEKKEARFEMLHEATNRRLDLDDKRFELEKEERKHSLVERKKMIHVMEMLAKKLG